MEDKRKPIKIAVCNRCNGTGFLNNSHLRYAGPEEMCPECYPQFLQDWFATRPEVCWHSEES